MSSTQRVGAGEVLGSASQVLRERWHAMLPGTLLIVVTLAVATTLSVAAIQGTAERLTTSIGAELGQALGVEGPLDLSKPDVLVRELGIGRILDPEQALADAEAAEARGESPAAPISSEQLAGLEEQIDQAGGPEAVGSDPGALVESVARDRLGRIDAQALITTLQGEIRTLMMKLLVIGLLASLGLAWGLASTARAAARADSSGVASLVHGLAVLPRQTSQIGWAYLPPLVLFSIPALGLLVDWRIGVGLLALTSVAIIPVSIYSTMVATVAGVRASLGELAWRPSVARRGVRTRLGTVLGVHLVTGICLVATSLPSWFHPALIVVLAPAWMYAVSAWVQLDYGVIAPPVQEAHSASPTQAWSLDLTDREEHGVWIQIPPGAQSLAVSVSGGDPPELWSCGVGEQWTQHDATARSMQVSTVDGRLHVLARRTGTSAVRVTLDLRQQNIESAA